MRRIINSTFITLDGAVENPHLWPSLGSAAAARSLDLQSELLQSCDALVMGRHTYDSFSAVWPTRKGDSFADRLNAMPKYVASSTLREAEWNNSSIIGSDLVGRLEQLKQQPGKNILQYGLGQVSFLMFEHGLLDEIRLWVHPLILGRNAPRVPQFLQCPPARLRLVDSESLPNGIAVLRYEVERAAA